MKIKYNYSLGRHFTFEECKKMPVYRWFYYKEGFSPEVVDFFLKKGEVVLDPFCGVGTVPLRCAEKGEKAYGLDISPLAVLVSKTKTTKYGEKERKEIIEEMKKLMDFKEEWEWRFELFPPKRAFPPSNYNALTKIRAGIEKIENEKVKNFLLTALLSILPTTSFIIKDGGVLKIIKKKKCAPLKEMFRRRVKLMIKDSEKVKIKEEPKIVVGDARMLPFEKDIFDAILTSPPYLNNVDYSKVYGLELSLLIGEKATKEMRANSLRSFITRKSDEYLEEIGEINIPLVHAYFADMKRVIKEGKRVLKKGGRMIMVVSNAVIRRIHIPVDEILGKIGESEGLEAEIIIGAERIADVKPHKLKVRESAVILHSS